MRRTMLALVCLLALISCSALFGQQADNGGVVTMTTEELEAIRARLDQLETEVRLLRDQLGTAAPVVPVEEPELVITGGTTSSGVPQSLLPDISIVGDLVGRVSSDKEQPARDNIFVRDAEVAFQGYFYPQIRGDMIIAMEDPNGTGELNATLEEAYVTFQQIGNSDFSSKIGKNRLDFGKVNKLHPHQWMYVTQPTVYRNFFGPDGVIVQGGSLGWLLPSRGLFANVEAGAWRNAGHHHEHAEEGEEHEHELGSGLDDSIYSGRLWTSAALSGCSELQLGASIAHGTGLREEDPFEFRDKIALAGVDLTYKLWPAAHKRLLLQAEGITYRRESNVNYGWYAFANYQWSKYWNLGLRYDWSERPWPIAGHDSGISAILTNQLTESTALRLQFTHGNSTGIGTVNEGFFQIIWGIGPHSHPLE